MADINVVIQKETISVNINTIELLNGSFTSQAFTGDGTTDTFEFTSAFRQGSLMVFKNGIFQEKDTDYTEAQDRKSITFMTAPKGASGNRTADKVEVRYVIE